VKRYYSSSSPASSPSRTILSVTQNTTRNCDDLFGGFLPGARQLENCLFLGGQDELSIRCGIVDVGADGDTDDVAGCLEFPLDAVERLPNGVVLGDVVEELDGLFRLGGSQFLDHVDVRVGTVADDGYRDALEFHYVPHWLCWLATL
jgi:hypothetical protein